MARPCLTESRRASLIYIPTSGGGKTVVTLCEIEQAVRILKDSGFARTRADDPRP